MLDDHVGVPEFADLNPDGWSSDDPGDVTATALEPYLERLRASELVVEVVQARGRRHPTGLVEQVEPAAGTLVAPGSTVTVTVAP